MRLRSGRAELVQRARLVLMLSAGRTYAEVEKTIGCSSPYVTRWKRRFLKDRIRGLSSRHVGGQPRVMNAKLEARILNKTRIKPSDGSTHWSTRKLAAELGISHMMVARVWARAGLKPHRLERYMASDDPDFERKADEVAAKATAAIKVMVLVPDSRRRVPNPFASKAGVSYRP